MAKPKAKTEEQKNAELEMMLSEAATSNLLASPSATRADKGTSATLVEDSPSPKQLGPAAQNENEEQKGEKASVAPSNEAATPTVPESTPAPETATPAQASQPAPAAPASTQVTPSVVAAPAQTITPEVEGSQDTAPESAITVEVGTLDLASLFAPSAAKKVVNTRLSDAHYQYLLMLGTIVGNGASPPEIVHNLIAQFIDKNDAQIQKAIAKQLRQRPGKK